MNELISLTQANGKKLLIPNTSILILESLNGEERASIEHGFCGIWYDIGRGIQSAVLSDKWGYVMRLTGGAQNRVEFATHNDKAILLAPNLIGSAREFDNGTELATTLSLPSGAPLIFVVIETVDDVIKAMGITVPSPDEQDEGEPPLEEGE